MLSQRIGKLFLFREWGLGGQLVLQRLETSRIEFECNLAELQRSGKGIPELAAQLVAKWMANGASLKAC